MQASRAHWKKQGSGSEYDIVIGAGIMVVGIMWNMMILTFLGALLVLFIVARSLIWRKLFRDMRKYHDDISVTFSDEKVRTESCVGTSDLRWDAFKAYFDTKDFILLYINKHAFSIIPKKAFSNPDQLEFFMNMVRRHLDPIKFGLIIP